ncbi:MAG TPA: threonylcarbamoyl-AMP synthase [Candidatus Paenalcaligenes intestinipullorum]|uniref:Threonylcarbamoyl-AMP synthase n=1 Tax=Candidatus Paenalcaligenes intestinipullorum TaxID=2838718 RepID=A0A9D2U9D5_9BURK|nr:threonylcarbamoyl-AMP synthase [Candidatus Paenalcaligenes intestinipullorum]
MSHLAEADAASIQRAAHALVEGLLVAFPTETVYGLGADAENPTAIAGIYQAKGRPSNHPLIVHVAPGADMYYWATDLTPEAWRLIECFWPGPLTLIVSRAAHIPAEVAGGQATLGIRCPQHPVAQALLTAFAQLKGGQGGVAAPSANRFGQVSPTTAAHVQSEFADQALQPAVILDGGPAQVGIESTIVDVSRGAEAIAVLRPGSITVAQIEAALGRTVQVGAQADAPRVSGSLKAHYAPRTPLYFMPLTGIVSRLRSESVVDKQNEVKTSSASSTKVAVVSLDAAPSGVSPSVQWLQLPHDPHVWAQRLYAVLRQLDTQSLHAIYVQSLPTTPEWAGVNDRLSRAAAAFEDTI